MQETKIQYFKELSPHLHRPLAPTFCWKPSWWYSLMEEGVTCEYYNDLWILQARSVAAFSQVATQSKDVRQRLTSLPCDQSRSAKKYIFQHFSLRIWSCEIFDVFSFDSRHPIWNTNLSAIGKIWTAICKCESLVFYPLSHLAWTLIRDGPWLRLTRTQLLLQSNGYFEVAAMAPPHNLPRNISVGIRPRNTKVRQAA